MLTEHTTKDGLRMATLTIATCCDPVDRRFYWCHMFFQTKADGSQEFCSHRHYPDGFVLPESTDGYEKLERALRGPNERWAHNK